ncbi:Ketosamine-3-kinase [Ascobolus immersus RN42]|uniref:protein-ribulosamine 3-kinase n=1 Tax=Ascobolus immersus RN42 TaxID=1160509 RepID=A0A3N4IL18_ASCIM|nr:Ketosamine-3-kinase [Ascobolus immersus RN42]
MSPVSDTLLQALISNHSLPADTTSLSHGGSSFTSTCKLTSSSTNQTYFLKTSTQDSNAPEMLLGEYKSLDAISNAVPDFCPTPIAHGTINGTSYLLTSFLHLDSRGGRSDEEQRGLARSLAKLHTSPSPNGQFGFDVPTYCGATKQDNTWHDKWADFFSEARLGGVVDAIKKERRGRAAEVEAVVGKVREKVVRRLLGEMRENGESVKPVLVHGDLWGGNCGWVRDDSEKGQGGVRGVVFDPSASYSASEFEIGIMRMFGGFNGVFWEEYHKLVPKAEPVDEFEDRVKLYEAYHYLNHYALFGGSYGDGAVDVLKGLIKKYGG